MKTQAPHPYYPIVYLFLTISEEKTCDAQICSNEDVCAPVETSLS